MALPLRKSSIVSEAMNGAKDRAMYELAMARKVYAEQIRDLAFAITQSEAGMSSSSELSFKAYREKIMNSIERFDTAVGGLRAVLMAAFDDYDLNVREIEAWLTATKAADKVAGRDTGESAMSAATRPYSFGDLMRWRK